MRIALDTMGTDARPTPDIAGGILAAQEYGHTILLVGDKKNTEDELNKHNTNGLKIEIHHADESITMDDKPSDVIKSKPNSTLHVGMNLVKDGVADGFVTMGNTGAIYAISMLSTLKRIRGVKRPALSTIYNANGHNVIVLDIGANSDSKAEWLVQFGVMGSIYAEKALNYHNPRVATLSNGEEEGKGNIVVRETEAILQSMDINYIGHVEPKEIVEAKADVIIVDGFVGNIFLKTFEGSIRYFSDVIRQEVTSDWMSKIGALLLRPALRRVRDRLDTSEIGGAPLLGVNGVVIVGHGGSNEIAIKNAIRQASIAVQGNIVTHIEAGINAI